MLDKASGVKVLRYNFVSTEILAEIIKRMKLSSIYGKNAITDGGSTATHSISGWTGLGT